VTIRKKEIKDDKVSPRAIEIKNDETSVKTNSRLGSHRKAGLADSIMEKSGGGGGGGG